MADTSRQPRQAQTIVLFGLGAQLQTCYPQIVAALGREPDYVCDNAPEKWGRTFFGKRCLSPADVAALGREAAVVITVRRYEAIASQMRDLGVSALFVACIDQGYEVVLGLRPLGETAPPPSAAGIGQGVKGRWTLVTGASRGIGRVIALEMARLGAHLVLHARSLEHTQEAAAACAACGAEVRTVEGDLAAADGLEGLLDRIAAAAPQIDVVFNNAGISLPGGGDIWNLPPAHYLQHYAVNTVAPVRICYRFVPPMIRRGWGRVINISSTIQNRPAEMAYACSKAALNKFVHDLAPSLRGTGVAMSLVCPGHVRSDMGGPQAPHPVENVVPGVLLGALGDDADAVNGRWFIAQDYAGCSLAEAVGKAQFYYGESV